MLVVCADVTSVLTLTLRYLYTALSFSTHSGTLSLAGGLCDVTPCQSGTFGTSIQLLALLHVQGNCLSLVVCVDVEIPLALRHMQGDSLAGNLC